MYRSTSHKLDFFHLQSPASESALEQTHVQHSESQARCVRVTQLKTRSMRACHAVTIQSSMMFVRPAECNFHAKRLAAACYSDMNCVSQQRKIASLGCHHTKQ